MCATSLLKSLWILIPLKRVSHRPYFFAVPGGPDGGWFGLGGAGGLGAARAVAGWLHYNHDWEEADMEGEKRCWKCLDEWDGGHPF